MTASYVPPVYVRMVAAHRSLSFRAVDATGRRLGDFSHLSELIRTVDLQDIVVFAEAPD